jgi:hypothetical protein
MSRQNHALDRVSSLPFAPSERRDGRNGVLNSGPAQTHLPPASHSLAPHLLGLPFPVLSWGETLLVLDAAARAGGGNRTVGFLTFAGFCRSIVDPAAREQLMTRLLLPADRTLALMLSVAARRPVDAVDTFQPVQVVSSLLTYMERRRILLVGADAKRLEATHRFIRSHAPWHEVITEADSAGADLLLVDGEGSAAESRLEQDVNLRHHGLIVPTEDLFTHCVARQRASQEPTSYYG